MSHRVPATKLPTHGRRSSVQPPWRTSTQLPSMLPVRGRIQSVDRRRSSRAMSVSVADLRVNDRQQTTTQAATALSAPTSPRRGSSIWATVDDGEIDAEEATLGYLDVLGADRTQTPAGAESCPRSPVIKSISSFNLRIQPSGEVRIKTARDGSMVGEITVKSYDDRDFAVRVRTSHPDLFMCEAGSQACATLSLDDEHVFRFKCRRNLSSLAQSTTGKCCYFFVEGIMIPDATSKDRAPLDYFAEDYKRSYAERACRPKHKYGDEFPGGSGDDEDPLTFRHLLTCMPASRHHQNEGGPPTLEFNPSDHMAFAHITDGVVGSMVTVTNTHSFPVAVRMRITHRDAFTVSPAKGVVVGTNQSATLHVHLSGRCPKPGDIVYFVYQCYRVDSVSSDVIDWSALQARRPMQRTVMWARGIDLRQKFYTDLEDSKPRVGRAMQEMFAMLPAASAGRPGVSQAGDAASAGHPRAERNDDESTHELTDSLLRTIQDLPSGERSAYRVAAALDGMKRRRQSVSPMLASRDQGRGTPDGAIPTFGRRSSSLSSLLEESASSPSGAPTPFNRSHSTGSVLSAMEPRQLPPPIPSSKPEGSPVLRASCPALSPTKPERSVLSELNTNSFMLTPTGSDSRPSPKRCPTTLSPEKSPFAGLDVPTFTFRRNLRHK